MKIIKKFALVGVLSMLTVTSVAAASGVKWYANNSIRFDWRTDWDLAGDYIAGTGTGYGKQKQVYVRMGESATLSKWAPSTTLSIREIDYGPFGAIGNLDYDAYLNIK